MSPIALRRWPRPVPRRGGVILASVCQSFIILGPLVLQTAPPGMAWERTSWRLSPPFFYSITLVIVCNKSMTPWLLRRPPSLFLTYSTHAHGLMNVGIILRRRFSTLKFKYTRELLPLGQLRDWSRGNNSPLSLYCFELGMYTYQNQPVGCHPAIWSKINFSHKVRYQIKAEVVIFLLHYWSGVESASLPRTNGRKLSKVESLLEFGQWSSLPEIYPS